MALLTPNDLEQINIDLEKNKNIIEKLTKKKLINLYESIYNTEYKNECIGIVPVTSGNGIINNFSESILYTLQLFGINAFITKKTDVTGYQEAIIEGADIIFMADDTTYLAHNLKNNKISNNNQATSRIYSELLINIDLDNRKKSKEVLIIGLGNVGKPSIEIFLRNGYNVYIYDVDVDKVNKITKEYPLVKKYDFNQKYSFLKILEATPNENTIPEFMLMNNTIVSTPGIPRAISEVTEKKYNVNLIMEPLGLGTLSMLYEVL